MKQAEGITEQLKAADQLKWVGMMNSIRNCGGARYFIVGILGSLQMNVYRQ